MSIFKTDREPKKVMLCEMFNVVFLYTIGASKTSYPRIAMVDEHKDLVFNRESEHCVFPLDFNGRVPGGPSARFSVS